MEEEKELIVNRLNNSFIEISKFKEYEINKNRKASKEYINNSLAILNRKKSNYSIEN
ncbi:MAG: hypothetical protein JJE21_09280 [Spirochaetaceae bacterium]|nr:hypothetical protein [Spirochaetaceae bacterium]